MSSRHSRSLAALLALLLATPGAFAQTTCNATSLCPESAPCCSEYGFCGSGSTFCLGGCNPLGSHTVDSCTPNPVCQSATYTFGSNARVLTNATYFDGNATAYDFTIDKGDIMNGTNGELVMLLTQENGGTRLSSTRYLHYGSVSTKMKTGKWAGVVATTILMSNVKDEIDWEFPGAATSEGQTNYFWLGEIPAKTLGSVEGNLTDTAANWHTYTVDWTADTLSFIIDNQTVRTVNKADTLDASGVAHYPSTPARIQLSLWPAGINTSAQGTIDWAGGLINWNDSDYQTAGHFWATVASVDVKCGDSPPAGITSYVYGANASALTPGVTFSNESTLVNGAVSALRGPQGVWAAVGVAVVAALATLV